MYTPQFPYLGNQAIITSGRVVIHSSDDFIFHFGKKGVAISTPATFTVDSNEKTAITAPLIELGYNAKTVGSPMLLGNKTVVQLGLLIDQISAVAGALSKLTESNMASALPAITKECEVLVGQCTIAKNQLQNFCLSKTTYTI